LATSQRRTSPLAKGLHAEVGGVLPLGKGSKRGNN
jgi:hypothetical protein